MKNLSHITTHLVVLVVVGATLFETGMQFDRIVLETLQVNVYRLTESDFRFSRSGHITHTVSDKVLPSGECIRSVYPAHMQQRLPAYNRCP